MCSYLEEVKTYDFVVVCVQVIEGLCGEYRVITNSRRQGSHSTRANNKYTHCSFKRAEGDDTHCTWSPVWPDTWQSCQSQQSCPPPCSAGWSTGTGCCSAWTLEAGTKNTTQLTQRTSEGFLPLASAVNPRITRRFQSHPHLVGAHAARFIHVELPEYVLAMAAWTIGKAEKQITEVKRRNGKALPLARLQNK